MVDRRSFGAALLSSPWLLPNALTRAWAQTRASAPFRFGLVTYLWGRDLSLPELLRACRGACEGVELRTTHAHGVEPALDAEARRRVRGQFEDAGITLVGLGSDERFDAPDPAVLRRAIDVTRRFLQLSHDVGGSGVKVKPDRFHEGVPRERTIEQIGRALGELGPFAEALGQEVRLEVHGGCADARTIDQIMQVADHPAARVCWNSNPQDLHGLGFVENFRRLRPWFGQTLHVREQPRPAYPEITLLELLAESAWDGWVLLEAHSRPGPKENRSAALHAQRRLRDEGVARAARDRWTGPIRMRDDETRTITVGDRTLARCRVDRLPVLHPIMAAGGRQVVRGFPLAPRDGESNDHPHHVGFWVAHGDVDGHDFWHAPECRVDLASETITAMPDGSLRMDWRCVWLASGAPIVDEQRTMTFSTEGLSARIDVELTLAPRAEAVTFGDTKEGFFALRLAPELKVDAPPGTGRLVNDRGDSGSAVWGRRANWILAEGPIDGRLVRVRMRDATDGAPAPTWWHARTYGLLAANPFGRRAFEGAAADDGAVVVHSSAPLRLRYVIETEVI